MFRYTLTILIILINLPGTFATHNRAGEITYRHVDGYTFRFTITTYTYRYSPANRDRLPVSWGDGSTSQVPIFIEEGFQQYGGHIPIEGTDYYYNRYIINHTYSGPGVYEILMEDPNRNQGVNNIPNSVNVVFSIKTTLLVDPTLGSNNTPVLLNPPIDKAARGHLFIHNPGAYDPDGDSISYELTICTGGGGEPIDSYTYPAATDTLEMDEITGDLIWNTPAVVGVYNIAMFVEEWRRGVLISRIARDMQIDVFETDNNPPVNPEIKDYCILAGDTLGFTIHSTDADGDMMTQEMVGGPFETLNPAVFEVDSANPGNIYSHFSWHTECLHARNQPYNVVLKTEDTNDDIHLVDIKSFNIKVLHRAPENLRLSSGVDTIRLDWDVTTCGNAAGYDIYRRKGGYDYQRDSCETGVPTYTGYKLIGKTTGGNINYFVDDDNGNGLVPGFDYCYRITAYYNDGAESISSDEMCTTLISGNPAILKISVISDDENDGEIELAWAVPHDADTLGDGRFRYQILRADPNEEILQSIAFIDSPDLTDTTYIDEGINTLVFPYTYSVVLQYSEEDAWYSVPGNEIATSQYITIDGTDNTLTLYMKKRSPWFNYRYDIYRQNNNSPVFDSVGTTDEQDYTDTGLRNNVEYTYRTIGFGMRPLYNTEYYIQNRSHLATGTPVDTVPPCSPVLIVTSECDSVPEEGGYNYLSWSWPDDSCSNEDVIAFIVYSRDSLTGEFEVIDTLNADRWNTIDFPEGSIEKCYAVTAIDSVRNESPKLPVCVYNLCALYRLPNIFTPNSDGIHDELLSWNLNNYIKRVNMKIYNRFGKLVFETNDPDIHWDGRNKENDKLVTSGVYYYICDVYEPRITGQIITTLTGFIHVYSGEDNIIAE
ncbi:MAG: gliding motility-associated C-terminal domain-containing protein [Bacteroidales bacterium]|nr:gliding motility-associated C-terminal domain-containing protein [Bacteroidales bacterium]